MDHVGNARALASEQQRVVGAEGEAMIGEARLSGEQHEASAMARAEVRPGFVPRQLDGGEIVHAGALHPPFAEDESRRLDDVDADAQEAPSRSRAPAFCGMSGS